MARPQFITTKYFEQHPESDLLSFFKKRRYRNGGKQVSYFFACSNGATSETIKLEHMFSDFVSSSEKITIRANRFFAQKYYESKVIQDVVIRHQKSESWIMLIGMPLVKDITDQGSQTLMDNFLKDYARTLSCDIDGHFALLAYDARKKRFIAATDCNSFIPVFYSATSTGVVFCSSELALARLRRSEIDPLGFSQAIYLGVTWDDGSRFKDIRKMRACELLIIDEENNCHRENYWQPGRKELWNNSLDETLPRWMSLLRDSVLMFYESATAKETVWTDFTGGEDARLIVAQCHALGLPYRARVGGFPENPDIVVAGKAAKEAGFELAIEPYY